MKSLNDLNELIWQNRQSLGISRQNYDVFMEGGTLEPGGLRHDENGIRYADYRYDMALEIEQLHSDRAAILMVMLRQWVDGLENRNGLDEPKLLTTPLSSKKVDVEMTLEVRDPIYIHPDVNGPLELAGVRYSIGEAVWNVAQQGRIRQGDA